MRPGGDAALTDLIVGARSVVDGARIAYEGLRPILQQRDPALDKQLDTRFTALQTLLDQQRSGEGFKLYDEVSSTA